MRPAGRGELDSLYFQYPNFDPPQRRPDNAGRPHEVVIVGAGPVGLVAALTLARDGIPSLVVERKSTFNDGSRAICIARQSFHILDRLGALGPFLEKSLGWTTSRSFYRGRQVLEFDMPHGPDEKFLPMYNLQQQYIEQFLWQAAARSDLIEFCWQSEVVGLRDHDDSVILSIRDPGGDYEIETNWLLAADGARSRVRALRGLRLAGENYEGRYVIADVQMAHDYPTVRRALFDPACNPGGTVLVHRQPDDIWRVDYQLPEGESEAEATREDVVREKVAAILADIGHQGPWQLEWWSVYSANTLALDDYRDGRVFFIGDSAHIVPIFGVRGLNNGIADAENIAWKLARVIDGRAGAGLLDSYSPERRNATLDVFANASKSTRFMTPPSDGWRLMRDAALSLALDHDFASAFANPRQMTPYTYAASPLTTADAPAFDGGPSPGSVAPDVRLGDADFLSNHFGTSFTGIVVAPPAELDVEQLHAAMQSLDPHFALLVVGSAGPLAGAAGVTFVPDAAGDVARRYAAGPGAFYLLRPDMHIAARWPDTDSAAVAATLAQSLDLTEPAR